MVAVLQESHNAAYGHVSSSYDMHVSSSSYDMHVSSSSYDMHVSSYVTRIMRHNFYHVLTHSWLYIAHILGH
jgi:hypothetical protein